MTWRWYQENVFDDESTDVVTFLMPVLWQDTPTEYTFWDYSDESGVRFVVRYYMPLIERSAEQYANSADDLSTLISLLVQTGYVIIDVMATRPIDETEDNDEVPGMPQN